MDEITECSCGYKNLIQNEEKHSFRDIIFGKLVSESDKKSPRSRLSFSETIFQAATKNKKFNVTKLYNWLTNKKKDSEKLKTKMKTFNSETKFSSIEITEHIQENRYIELHVYFTTFDFIEIADFHITMIVPSSTMVFTVLDLIHQRTDIQADAFSLFISFNKFRKNRHPLPKMSTLKECGYPGYCKRHPQKVLLFYNCNIRFKSNFISTLDKHYNINKENKTTVCSSEAE